MLNNVLIIEKNTKKAWIPEINVKCITITKNTDHSIQMSKAQKKRK